MFSDTSTAVVVDPGNPEVDDKQTPAANEGITATDPDQEYNEQTAVGGQAPPA